MRRLLLSLGLLVAFVVACDDDEDISKYSTDGSLKQDASILYTTDGDLLDTTIEKYAVYHFEYDKTGRCQHIWAGDWMDLDLKDVKKVKIYDSSSGQRELTAEFSFNNAGYISRIVGEMTYDGEDDATVEAKIYYKNEYITQIVYEENSLRFGKITYTTNYSYDDKNATKITNVYVKADSVLVNDTLRSRVYTREYNVSAGYSERLNMCKQNFDVIEGYAVPDYIHFQELTTIGWLGLGSKNLPAKLDYEYRTQADADSTFTDWTTGSGEYSFELNENGTFKTVYKGRDSYDFTYEVME